MFFSNHMYKIVISYIFHWYSVAFKNVAYIICKNITLLKPKQAEGTEEYIHITEVIFPHLVLHCVAHMVDGNTVKPW